MIQVLLKDVSNTALTVWAADRTRLGDRVRWNGSSWFVSAVYGTKFYGGYEAIPEARKREKPDDSPLERFD